MDRFILGFDRALRTLSGTVRARRTYPAVSDHTELGDGRRLSVALMRVNHSGEVCAQALYQAQALLAKDRGVHAALVRSADEECDHLDWTARRVTELGGRTSALDPLWFAGAFLIGGLSATFGDRVSLGFLRETERQVVAHLEGHLGRLPSNDPRSREIVSQMRDDEAAHAMTAEEMGAAELPSPLPGLMRFAAKVMTSVAYVV
jgi:3-demethoxyubiquinol 3-hydroxylase